MIRFQTYIDTTSQLYETLASIPGVTVHTDGVTCTDDVGFVVQSLLGQAVFTRKPERLRAIADARGVRGYEKLWPFQKEDAQKLARGEACGTWAACGTGKSSVLLAACDLARLNRVLVITKAIGRESYPRDLTWIGNRRCAVLIGQLGSEGGKAAARRADKLMQRYRDRGADVIAINDAREALDRNLIVAGWETIAESHKDATGRSVVRPRIDLAHGWDGLVLDEHHLGKGKLSARTQAVMALAKQSRIVWSATATPVADRLRDLWPQWHVVASKAAGRTSSRFERRYCHAQQGQYGWDNSGPCAPDSGCVYCTETTAELKRRLTFFFIVRTREVIRDLIPPKRRERIHITSDKAVRAIDRGAGRDKRAIEGAIAIAADAKLEDCVGVATDYLHSGGKVVFVGNRLAWVPKAVAAIERAVSKVRKTKDRLWLRHATGETPAPVRRALADEYMQQRGPAILVATMGAVCESMDLQDSDALISCALPYTPKEITQLEGRVSRIGQKRPCTIYYPIADGTIDERIEEQLLGKLAIVEGVGADTEESNFDPYDGTSEAQVIAGLCNWLAGAA